MEWTSIIMFAGILVVMYFIMFLPQRKKEKQVKQLRNNLEVGDIVVTESGIVGRVISTKDMDTVTIETGADKTRLKFKRWAVLAKEESE